MYLCTLLTNIWEVDIYSIYMFNERDIFEFKIDLSICISLTCSQPYCITQFASDKHSYVYLIYFTLYYEIISVDFLFRPFL